MRRSLLALPVLGLLALTACSSSDSASSATPTSPGTSATAAADIVGVAAATPDLSTLVAAVKAAGLVGTLQGEGPYTVFAPTNDAFAALPNGVVDKLLLKCNKDALTKVLTYHVVSGKVESMDIKPGDVPTVEGQSVTLATDGGVTVNGASVVQADVPASNGVVHVVDQVLVPSDLDVSKLKATC
jgi:uncharacterized surface protein with fasciclin (FAS1) repeats